MTCTFGLARNNASAMIAVADDMLAVVEHEQYLFPA
jgi:hypothetical protein